MSIRRYIDIDSARRDRKSYPFPGDFVVEVNSSYRNTPTTAQDPILLAFPYEANQLSGGSTFTQIALSVLASPIVNFYRNSYIEINGIFRKCIAYNQTTQVATVEAPGFAGPPPALTPYTIRKELPYERNITSAASATLTEIYLANPGASNVTDFYKDKWVFLPGLSTPTTFQWSRISSYNGVTKRATLTNPFVVPVGLGVTYEILNFSYDHVVPLRYIGTENFSNATCETVRLVNIVVPNGNILTGYGGTLQNYPHLYVSVWSEKGITYNNPIISNNPASTRALFKVPVSFLPNTNWLTLSLSAMNQNVPFREMDSLHVQIVLPTGDILVFEPYNSLTYFTGIDSLQGGLFPIPSDPNTQVHLVLEITR